MVGTIRLSGKDYRWVYGVRASYIYQTLFGKIQEETDSLKAFEVNVKFLYSCIKASDELRLIDGQYTELNEMKIGEFELKIHLPDGWYKVEKCFCEACKEKYLSKLQNVLNELDFEKAR